MNIFNVVPVTRVNGLTVELIDEKSDIYLLIGGMYEDNSPARTQMVDVNQILDSKYLQSGSAKNREVWDKFIPLTDEQLGELPQLSFHKSVTTLNSIFVFGKKNHIHRWNEIDLYF